MHTQYFDTLFYLGKADLGQKDESRDVPRSMAVALDSLGDHYFGVIKHLEEAGMETKQSYNGNPDALEVYAAADIWKCISL